MNIVVRTRRPGCHCTGCSHRLIDISRRDICSVPRLSDVSFLTGNRLLWDGNCHPVIADPRTMVARNPYFRRMDDRLGASGR